MMIKKRIGVSRFHYRQSSSVVSLSLQCTKFKAKSQVKN